MSSAKLCLNMYEERYSLKNAIRGNVLLRLRHHKDSTLLEWKPRRLSQRRGMRLPLPLPLVACVMDSVEAAEAVLVRVRRLMPFFRVLEWLHHSWVSCREGQSMALVVTQPSETIKLLGKAWHCTNLVNSPLRRGALSMESTFLRPLEPSG